MKYATMMKAWSVYQEGPHCVTGSIAADKTGVFVNGQEDKCGKKDFK